MREVNTPRISAKAISATSETASFENATSYVGGEHGTIDPATSLHRQFRPHLAGTLFTLDLFFIIGLIAILIFTIRYRLDLSTVSEASSAIACIGLASVILAYAMGCYRADGFIDFSTATTRLAVGLAVGVLLLVPLLHFGLSLTFDSLAFRSISRSLTIVLVGVGAGLCGGMLSRILFMAMMRRHWLKRTILIVGTGRRARHLRDLLETSIGAMTQVYFVTEAYLGGTPPTNVPGQKIEALAGAPETQELIAKLHVNQVVLAVDDPKGLYFDHLLPWKAHGIPVIDFNTFLERETGRVEISWTEPDWLLYSDGFHFDPFDRVMKRLMDLAISTSLLLLTFPALLIVAAAIVIEDFGPVFYWQKRISLSGREFWIVKFRTMRVDAEKNGAQWASKNDPRITWVGRILRRTRIDEIPQLINVLKGDMSLVGPRPERPVFVNELSKQIRLYHLRHSVKSGLTGWAQINCDYGASVEDAKRKLEYDLYYLKHFSMLRDLSIILQTLRILLFAKGGR